MPAKALALCALAALPAVLSLAAALGGLSLKDGGSSAAATAAEELAARDERIAFFEARAQADPLDFLSLNALAGQYLQRARETGDLGDYARAGAAATRSLAIVPSDNVGALTALSAVHLARHDFAAAQTLASAAIALRPLSAAAYGLRGDAAFALGRYDEAEADYHRMRELEPGLAALSRLAHVAFVRGDLRNAKDFWRQALARDDGLPIEHRAWAQAQLGDLQRGLGELQQAERSYRAALETYAGYSQALAGLASVRAAQGRWDDSIALYSAVQARLPRPQYVAALGDVYARSGRPAAAEAQYELVAAIDALYRANGVSTDLDLALFYANRDRNLDEALRMAQAAYEASPGVYAADALAWALFKSNRLAEAKAMSREALRLGTPEAAFHFHAGMIHHGLGETAAATAQLERALALNPHFSLLDADVARLTLRALKGARP